MNTSIEQVIVITKFELFLLSNIHAERQDPLLIFAFKYYAAL